MALSREPFWLLGRQVEGAMKQTLGTVLPFIFAALVLKKTTLAENGRAFKAPAEPDEAEMTS